jgi:hypothetical protein
MTTTGQGGGVHDPLGQQRRHGRCPRCVDHEHVGLVGLVDQASTLASMDHSDLGSVVRTQHVDDVSIQLRPLLVPQLVQLRAPREEEPAEPWREWGCGWTRTAISRPPLASARAFPHTRAVGDFDVALTPTITV